MFLEEWQRIAEFSSQQPAMRKRIARCIERMPNTAWQTAVRWRLAYERIRIR
jgi:hypothetical protein